METEKLIILGSGPAGLTAAIYAARAGLEPLILEGETPGGQLVGTTAVENWPGEKSIQGPDLMQNMKEHAMKFETRFKHERLVDIETGGETFQLKTNKDTTYRTHALIVTTGATPRRLECPGEEKYWGKGVTTCAVCDGAFYKNEPVVIVGGGDTAMEDASFMKNFTDDITIVQIEDSLTASKAMQEPILDDDAITIHYNSTVTEIHGDDDGITEVTMKNTETDETEKIPARAVFIAIGLSPNTEAFENVLSLTEYGHIKTHDNTKTSVEGIFAGGDVCDPRYRQAVTSAGYGCMAALDAEKYLKKRLSSLE